MSWIKCCVISRITSLKKLTEKIIFSNLFICCCEFMILFNIFLNFERIVFQVALVSCFLRMLNKQAGPLLSYIKKNQHKMLFNPGWSTDMVNVDPTCWRSGLSDWKMYGLHINVTTNLWRNDSSLLILFNVPLAILPPLSYKQPLNISRK